MPSKILFLSTLFSVFAIAATIVYETEKDNQVVVQSHINPIEHKSKIVPICQKDDSCCNNKNCPDCVPKCCPDGCCGTVKEAKSKANQLLTAIEKMVDKTVEQCKNQAEQILAKSYDCSNSLQDTLSRSKRENKPYMLWVGMACTEAPEIRKAFPDAVHCHLDSLNNNSTPRIVAGKPGQSLNYVYLKSSFDSTTPQRIRDALNYSPPVQPVYINPVQQNQPVQYYNPYQYYRVPGGF